MHGGAGGTIMDDFRGWDSRAAAGKDKSKKDGQDKEGKQGISSASVH